MNTIHEFTELFLQARNEHRLAAQDASDRGMMHCQATQFAIENSIAGGEGLLMASLLSFQNDLDKALLALENIRTSVHQKLKGHWHHIQGFVFDELGFYDEAIKEFEKAIDFNDYVSKAATLINLGAVYAKKNEPSKAIEVLKRATEVNDTNIRCIALRNLGIVYSTNAMHDEAINCYQQALGEPGCTNSADLFYHLGVANFSKQDLPAAIDNYKKAVESENASGKADAYHNLGVTYAKARDYGNAIQAFKNALAVPDYTTPSWTRRQLAIAYRDSGDHRLALEEINGCISEIANVPRTESNSFAEDLAESLALKHLIESDLADLSSAPENEALVASPNEGEINTPDNRMRQKLIGLEDQYQYYISKSPSSQSNVLSILRGWSSAVTLLEGGTENKWRGGGYFVKWRDKGLVLDPGFDFLDNFHDKGYHITEVDAILVSHNHPDHNSDLGALDDLRYEVFRRKFRTTEDNGRVPMLSKLFLGIDEDTIKAFRDDHPPHRGSIHRFTRADSERKRWVTETDLALPFTIQHFPVIHGDDVTHAVGFVLELHNSHGPDVKIGFTGDTEYFEQLPEYLSGCDLLIAHISQPDPREFTDRDFRKRYHLGLNGVERLVREVNPKLTLLGEFWAGLADLRIDITKSLRLRLGTDAILPSGIGMNIQLPQLKIECTECHRAEPFASINIVPSPIAFGHLGYVCRNCLI